ncbi:MAG: MoxR family ATPase [Spirochaetales bacterium]|nr:MoxR family ATPase [Spirochaetales bacterium]
MAKELTIEDVHSLYEKVKEELQKVIIGQEDVIEHAIISLFSGGHILIEGVPGLGKTLLVSALSYIVGCTYKRIQFTPDLMPADIIGTTVYNVEDRSFLVKKGPVFTNMLLADEINRSPAKTQSALLEAMQERQVTIDGTIYPLEGFFICFATQNPIEMEGTYPLPEAQIDRFLMKVLISYPGQEDENQILKNYRQGFEAEHPATAEIKKILDVDHVIRISRAVGKVMIDDKIIDYITRIVTATRNYSGIAIGSSPRGSVALFKASRVKAIIEGRDFVNPDDVKSLVLPVLRHRLILDAESEIEGITPDDYLKKILVEIEVPR